MRLRSSLLWTFTGAFLAVLIGGVILQVILISSVLRPAAKHWRSTTRRTVARAVASTVADALEKGREDIGSILLDAVRSDPSLLLVFRDNAGRITASQPPERMRPGMRMMLRGIERGRGQAHRHSVVGHADVVVEGEKRGEILVVPHLPDRAFGLEGAPRPWILFLPLAAILAGIAGFLLFRGLARRLGHLEEMVRRISDGELAVRVADTGSDEIGRLGEAFNEMAAGLEESRRHVQEVDQQRRRFLADVTHDLATPLTTIRGYAETLRNTDVPKDPEETARYLRFIQEEADRMDALVADLLDLARVESGSVPLDIERVDLTEVIRGETQRMRQLFQEGGLRLAGPESAAPTLYASIDPRRIEQLINNLLGNALHYLPSGCGVTVRIEEESDRMVRIIVEDDGPGFSSHDLPHLFERFYRGNPARPSGGTGLGLAIVRGIAHAHGGEAIAENRPQGGAQVTIRIPRGEDPRAR